MGAYLDGVVGGLVVLAPAVVLVAVRWDMCEVWLVSMAVAPEAAVAAPVAVLLETSIGLPMPEAAVDEFGPGEMPDINLQQQQQQQQLLLQELVNRTKAMEEPVTRACAYFPHTCRR